MLTLLTLLACAAEPPPAAALGPAALRGEPIAFSPWFSPEVTLSAARPGRYRGSLEHRYDGMISMERTISQWASVETELTIAEDGTARGCVTGTQGSRSTVSKYASDDGEHHVRSDEYPIAWGFEGRWERSGGWLLIWPQAMAWQGCEMREVPFIQELDGLLMCAQASLSGAEALLCHPVGSAVGSPLREHAALPIGPTQATQDGPGMTWRGREWLVLGAGEGLSISWRYRDGDEAPTVELGQM